MKKILAVLSLALVTIFAGCNKEDKLWDAIDALKNRVEALETQVNQLNTNVLALTKLHKDGSTVTSSVKDPLTGTWKITLSNGDVIDLKQGTEASATIPVMAINDAGNWEVSYDNGTTFTEIKRDGQPVKAETVSPLFRVDNDGFWQVSYDGGAKYDFVLDEKNQRVYAFKDGAPTDSFFTSVDVVDGELVIVMKNGEKLSVPIVKDFYCRILDVPADPIKFDAGAVKMYTVELKGVDNTIITTPEGWKAKLGPESNGSATLTVTAPAAAPIASKAATADSNKDIAILATSNKYATIAKLQVELVGGGEVAPPTLTSVAENAASKTATSLTFDVVMSTDASGFKYICQKSSDAAPTITQVTENGTAVAKPATSVTVNNLLPLTAYKIYVVAYKGTSTITYGETVLNAEATTKTDVVDYYEDGITIDGITYNKDSEGAELFSIPADASANVDIITDAPTATRVIFLDTPVNTNFKYTITSSVNSVAVDYDLIIIGRNSSSKPTITFKKDVFFALSSRQVVDAKFILKNVTVDMGLRANYMFNNQSAGKNFGLLLIEDCKYINLAKALYFRGVTANYGVKSMIFRNNTFKVTAQIAQFINMSDATSAIEYKNIVFTNNVLYSASVYTGQLISFSGTHNQVATGTWDNRVTVTNNTFVNYFFGNIMVKTYALADLDISKNIFQLTATQSGPSYLYSSIFNATLTPGTLPTTNAVLSDNVVYGGGDQNWIYYHSGSNLKDTPDGVNTITRVVDAPLTTVNTTTGEFVRSPVMVGAGIGSSLK